MGRIAIVSLLALIGAACSPAADQTQPEPAAQSQSTPLTTADEPEEMQRVEVDSNLTWAASVVQLDPLSHEGNGGVKLFGLAGGDPAMNGLHTYLAFYESPGDGWQVFRLGDFLSYRVLAEAPGRVELEIQESTMDEATGNIGSRTHYAIVSWTRGADNAPPMTISVTPAQQGG